MPRRARQLQRNCNPAHATVHEYRRCATASLARDDCGAGFLELQVRHRDFDWAVAERQAKCGTEPVTALNWIRYHSPQHRNAGAVMERTPKHPCAALRRICRTIADYWSFEKASIRLWLFPPRETPEDRAIREEGERLRRAFPAIDFDHPGARVWRPSDDA